MEGAWGDSQYRLLLPSLQTRLHRERNYFTDVNSIEQGIMKASSIACVYIILVHGNYYIRGSCVYRELYY